MWFLLLEAKELLGALSVVNLFYPCQSGRLKRLYAVESNMDSLSISPSVGCLIDALPFVNRVFVFSLLLDDQRMEISVVEILALEVALAHSFSGVESLSMGHGGQAECLLGSLLQKSSLLSN